MLKKTIINVLKNRKVLNLHLTNPNAINAKYSLNSLTNIAISMELSSIPTDVSSSINPFANFTLGFL